MYLDINNCFYHFVLNRDWRAAKLSFEEERQTQESIRYYFCTRPSGTTTVGFVTYSRPMKQIHHSRGPCNLVIRNERCVLYGGLFLGSVWQCHN
jgi:hypothetical protein